MSEYRSVGEAHLYAEAAREVGPWDPARGTQIDHIQRIADLVASKLRRSPETNDSAR